MIFWDGQVYLDLKKLSFLPPNIIIAQSKDLVKFKKKKGSYIFAHLSLRLENSSLFH